MMKIIPMAIIIAVATGMAIKEYTKVLVWFALVITVIVLASPFILFGFAARIVVVGVLFGYDKCAQFINWLY